MAERAAKAADQAERPAEVLRHRRDRALTLLGFWRGFRGDELLRVRAEHPQIVPSQGMICFLARIKADRQNAGTTYKVPALSRWYPVAAVETWLDVTTLTVPVPAPGLSRDPGFMRSILAIAANG